MCNICLGLNFTTLQPDTTLDNINCTELVKETACTLYIHDIVHDIVRFDTSKCLRKKIMHLKSFFLLLEVQAVHDVILSFLRCCTFSR